MKPAVVMLHGFTHTGASWKPVAAALDERYRALAPDIRGHGSSSAVRPVTLAAVIGDLDGLTTSNRLGGGEQLTLAGYSMGGRIALHAALALADQVQRLILVGGSPGIADPGERTARRVADEQLAEQLERLSIGELAKRWASTAVLSDQPPDVAAAAHADRLRSTPAGLGRALRGLGTGALPSLWGRLGELRMEVVLVVGERDQKFLRLASQMADQIADATLIVVPGAGHAVHLEAPERVARVISGS
ncbi:MAG: 2-succinyl-6-hydroxy-2,4-cyclohexadiene-1-carboxylate synthase [Solirubrobacteraceae bacterium]